LRIVYILLIPIWLFGQNDDIPSKSAAHLFNLGIGVDQPFGDLADRFGRNNKISGGYNFITSGDYLFGIDVSYYYGDNVKEDVLAPLRNANGNIVSTGELFSDVFGRQRGYYLGFEAGKIFPFKNRYRSGIKTTMGVGLLEHMIRIIDNDQNNAKLFGERKKGYDRLTRGLALRQYIGYHHLSVDQRINFTIGLEFTEGFTSSVRAVNWDTGLPGDTGRFDFIVGVKAVWVLPFWVGKSNEEIYY
jgi:hypothetical protein